MAKFMFDTNALNKALEHIDVIEATLDQHEYVITTLQIDENNDCTDRKKKRAQ